MSSVIRPQPFYSLALGAQEVSVLDMVRVYSTFMSRGERREPAILLDVTDSDGTVLERLDPSGERVMTRQEADVVTDVLTGVIDGGTGIGARVPDVPTAGKTGTTQDYRDAWFVGYSPRFTTAVWVGFPGTIKSMVDVAGLDTVTGGSVPALIWQQVMAAAHVGVDPGNFIAPGPYPGEIRGADVTVPPSTTEPPATTAAPTTTRPPATSAAPTTTEAPTTTVAPTTAVPTTTGAPTTTVAPTTAAPTTTAAG